MEKTNKILLNSQRLPNNVNVNTQIQLGMENTNKPLPLNDIDTTISQYEQFEKERKESTIYRFYGNVNPIISNPLFNDNVKIYLTGETGTMPKAKKIFSSGIFEKDGWVGYYNDELDEDALDFNDNKSALCEFFPFDPGYDRLSMLDSDGVPNYLMKITYPYESVDDVVLLKNNSNISIKDGIPVIGLFEIEINGSKYTGIKTLINHGLSEGSNVNLYNFIDNSTSSSLKLNSKYFRVIKLGNRTNDDRFRSFVVNIDPQFLNFNIGVSTIKRVVRGEPSQYYVRRFSGLTTTYTDYDMYPAAYGVTYFDDRVVGFNFKTDIDVKGLRDNLGRPITELYFTVLKNDNDADPNSINTQYWLEEQKNLPPPNNNRFWTTVKGGYNIEKNENSNYDVRSIGDGNFVTSEYYENIDESNDTFDGDIVEYNNNELLERQLEEVYHRVNTVYREDIKNKKEGYIYKPFNKIQIRQYANYINPVVDLQSVIDKFNITNPVDIDNLKKSFGIPDYAYEITTNVYKWRTILEIGEFDTTGGGVNYPFESGAHYVYLDKRFYFQRQDPPCDFSITTIELTFPLDSDGKKDFLNYLSNPTFLNYELKDDSDITLLNKYENDLLDYPLGKPPINVFVNFVSYFGDYELGERDVAGGCVDLSLLKQKTIDDVC
jgi:hypothetical protein